MGKKQKVAELRNKLNQLSAEKEEFYSKKQEIKHNIQNRINSSNSLRKERDELTKEVKELKKGRDEINLKIKEVVEKLKKLNETVKESKPKDNSFNPIAAKRTIDHLELKIETDAPSFDKERAIMKKIKELKKQLDASTKERGSFLELKNAEKELRNLKKQSNAIHKLIQEKAKLSQDKHEEMIKLSNGMDFKNDFEEIDKKIDEKKKEISLSNDELRKILPGMFDVYGKIDEKKKKRKEKRELETKLSLEEKKRLVEDKISKRKKLTTEDLLAFQSVEEK